LLYEISKMAVILNIGSELIFDDHIVKFKFHMYNPYTKIKVSIISLGFLSKKNIIMTTKLNDCKNLTFDAKLK